MRRRTRACLAVGAALAGLAGTVRPAGAHVDYVTDSAGDARDPVDFLVSVLTDPANAALVALAAGGVLTAVGAYLLVGRHLEDVRVLRATLSDYDDLVPWMLRLSMGLPLVGAGYAGYFFTPAVDVQVRPFQVAVGFLLLFGLATRAVAAVGLVAYLAGLAATAEMLLAVEYVGGFLAIVLLGGGRPSADEMLHRVAEADGTLYGRVDPVHRLAAWFGARVVPLSAYAPTVARVGLGTAFVYLGLVEKLMAPGRGLDVVAKYDLTAVVPVDPGLWVVGAGLVEVALGLALIAGLFTRGVAAVAFLTFTLTLFGLPDDPVLAHVTMFGLASAVFTTGAGPLALDGRLPALLDRLDPGERVEPGD